MNKPIQYKPDITCDNCGRYGTFDLGDEHLCSDCYQERGSCCMEFGECDLWEDDVKSGTERKTEQNNSKNK